MVSQGLSLSAYRFVNREVRFLYFVEAVRQIYLKSCLSVVEVVNPTY